MEIITTSRLKLREFRHADAKHLYELNNDPEVMRYTGDPPFKNETEALDFIQQYDHYKKHGYGRWAVEAKESGEFLGWCGLKKDELMNQTDVGFRFMKKYWNKGFATESAKACIEYGFDVPGLERIIGKSMKENTASIRVLEKCGMRFVKQMEFECHQGYLYEIIRQKGKNP